ncbi:methyl-accepting chemotaxis protein, partial [bacterium]
MSLMTLRIGPRLGLSFGLMVLLMVGMAVAALFALKRIDANLDTVVNDRYVKVRRVTGILDELNLQARNARNVLL